MKKKQITLSKKIGEIKKLKKLFQKVCSLLNDPIEMKDKALSSEAYKQACDIIQERMLSRSKQCIGFGSRPLLHRSPLHTIDEQRKGVEDAQLREAEKIYRSRDPVYAKAVDQYHTEITNLLTEIENCYYFLQDTFQTYPWIKDTLLAGNFEYFRKHYKSINKRWFVGEITGVLEKLDSIQYALEREQQPETNRKTSGGDTGEHQKENVLSGEPLALAMLVEHPDWSDTKIAETIGVNRTTLYDWPNFKKAKEALKQGRKNLPRGSKDGETGDIEAWNEKD